MAKLKNYLQFRNLAQYRTYITDTHPFSRYFRLTQLPDTLVGGKNAFLINGSPELEPTTEVLIEIIASDGSTIFQQPVKNYQEGLARIVSIEIYQDTPPGPATMTILGELRADENGNAIPPEWRNKYNVKYTHQFTVDTFRANDETIRFYKTPSISVSEQLSLYRDTITGSALILNAGSVTGFTFTSQFNSGDTVTTPTYAIKTSSPILSASLVGAPFTASIGSNTFTASITEVLNNTTAFLSNGYLTGSNYASFTTNTWNITTTGSSQYIASSFTRSFANITISELTTFSGQVQRAKIWMRSVDSHGDFEAVSDVVLQPTHLMTTQSADLSVISIGDITSQNIINSYWNAGLLTGSFGFPLYVPSPSVTIGYDASKLMNSMHITNDATLVSTGSLAPKYFIRTNANLSFLQGLEYVLHNDILCLSSGSFDAKLEVYLSGSAFPTTNTLGQLIASYDCNSNQLTSIADEENFIASSDGTATLNYVIYGGDWYIANSDVFSAFESGFNPDQATVLTPIINKRLENLQFKVQLFDLHNNAVPIDLYSPIVFFVGGNFFTKGTDNRLQGIVTLSPSGSGPVLGVNTSGSYIGMGHDVLPLPIDISVLPNYGGAPIISIYSGSTPYSGSVSGSAMGIQIAGGGVSGSFLDFNTLTGRLTIKGDITLLPGSALSQSIVSGSGGTGSTDGTLALQQIQQLVSGTLIGGTYLNGTEIISPTIAGNLGYFSTLFGVGNISAGKGIILSALGYTASNAIAQSGSPAIYIGQGTYGNANTPFMVASSSAGGILSLGNMLLATSSAGQFALIVSGTIAVASGSNNIYTDVRSYISTITSSLSGSLAFQAASYSQSLAQQAVSYSASLAAKEVSDSASIVTQNINFSASQAAANVVDLANKIKLPVSTKTVQGLYLETSSMGFWQPHPSGTGNSAANYPVVINDSGQFRIANSGSWSGPSTTGFFTDYISFANGAFVVNTPNLVLRTPGLNIAGFAPSASNLSYIKVGSAGSAVSLTANAGFYADGGGNVRFGTDTSGSDYLLLQPGNALVVSSSNFILQSTNAGNTLLVSPLQLALGNPVPTTYSPQGVGSIGFYANRSGQLFIGSGAVDLNTAGAGTGSWISFGGQAVNIRAQQFYLNAPSLIINSALNNGTITLGQATDVVTGSGLYMDGNGIGNFRVGNTVTSSLGYMQFISSSGILFASNLKANNATLTNATLISTTTASNITAINVSSSLGIYGSLTIDSSKITGANPYDSLIIYSGNVSPSFEMARFGRYTKIKGYSQSLGGAASSPNEATGALNGNNTYTYVLTSPASIVIPSTASFVNNAINVTSTAFFDEFNAITTAYGVEYILDVSASWVNTFPIGAQSSFTRTYDKSITISGQTKLYDTQTNYSIAVPTPPIRSGSTLFTSINYYVKTTKAI